MWIAILAALVVAVYLGIVGLAAAIQDALIFPVGMVAPGPERLPAYAERIEVKHDGETLAGVRLRPRLASPSTPLVIAFGGNAWNADLLALYLGDLYENAEIVAFHYRGYAPSSGRPAAAALLADAPVVFDAVVDPGTDRPVVAVGLSIGSGVAAWLASRRPVDGLILVSPFDSLHALARAHYPFMPVGLLLRHRIDTRDYLAAGTAPTAVIIAEDDAIVPPARTAALLAGLTPPTFQRTVAGADHNDLYGREEFAAAMVAALDRLLQGNGNPINNPNPGG